MAIAPSLLQAIKICCQACPPNILIRFPQGSIPESFVKKNITMDKVFQRLLKVTTPIEYKKYIGNFDFFSPNFQGLILVKTALISQVAKWRHVFMACRKLKAMAIYVVKQIYGNDIMASVYTVHR